MVDLEDSAHLEHYQISMKFKTGYKTKIKL